MQMYLYKHTQMHMYLYVNTQMHMHMRMHMRTHKLTHLQMHMHTHMRMHMRMQMHVHVHLHLQLHMHMHTYAYAHTYIYIYIYMHMNMHMDMHTQACVCVVRNASHEARQQHNEYGNRTNGITGLDMFLWAKEANNNLYLIDSSFSQGHPKRHGTTKDLQGFPRNFQRPPKTPCETPTKLKGAS